jgi:tetratricopeptide (TPR) repeat protein
LSPTEPGDSTVTGSRPAGLSFGELQTGVQRAEDDLRAGRYRAALDAYTVLLRGRLALAGGIDSFGAADLVVIERLAELATLFGLFGAADDLLLSMVELCRRAGNDLAADYTQLKRIETVLARGQLDEAYGLLCELEDRIGVLEKLDLSTAGLTRWEAAIEWRRFDENERSVLFTRAYLIMGQILSAFGRYGDALGVLGRGLAHAEDRAAPDLARRTSAAIRLARIVALLEGGDLDEAEKALLGLASEAEDNLMPATQTRRLELAGKLDFLRGRLGSATRNFEAVSDFCNQRSFARAGVSASLNLAHVLILLNRVGDALHLVEQARAGAALLGEPGLQLRAESIATLALARRRSPAAAASVSLSVREMIRARRPRDDDDGRSPQAPRLPPVPLTASFLTSFEDRALEFQWALGTDIEDAADQLDGIRKTFLHTDSRLIHARMSALEALLAFERDDFALAAGCFDTAAGRLTSLSLLPELWQVLHLRARCLDRLGRSEEAARLSEAAESLLEALTGSLEASDRAVFLLNKATVEEEFISTQIDALLKDQEELRGCSGLGNLRSRIRVMRRLHGIMEHIDIYKAFLADRQLTGRRGGTEPRQPSPSRSVVSLMRRLLGIRRDSAQISFLVLPDRLVVMWSGFLMLGFAVSPVTRLDLRERVRRWHELMHTAPVSGSRDISGAPEELEESSLSGAVASTGERLVGELGEALQLDAVLATLSQRVCRLSIVPDDVLHGVPFSALRYQGHHLVEKFALSIAYTTRRLTGVRRGGENAGLVVGVAQGFGQLHDLPQVMPESKATSAWLTKQGLQVRSLIDEDANREAVLNGLRRAVVAHIACHGTFEPDRPDQSGLELVPELGRRGRLTLRDLSSVRLDHCRHITLSSCWSADNFVVPGRWIISLPETLWRSGVGSTLGSLWAVDDEVAVAFMRQFYAGLERLPRDEALREAQIACLTNVIDCKRAGDGRRMDTSATFFWAGFTLAGEPGRLEL